MIGASVALTVQHQSQKKLLTANETLVQQIARLKADNESISNRAVRAGESASLSKDQLNELLRLRGEVGMLRQQTNELAQLRAGNQKPTPEVLQVESINQLSAEDQLSVRRTHVVNTETSLLRAVKSYAANHNGQNPGSFGELIDSGALTTTNFTLAVGGRIRLPSGKWLLVTPNLDDALSLDNFELLKAGVVDDQGRNLILRNRAPIPNPAGDPVWVYGGFSDRGMPMSVIISTDFTIANPHATQTATSPDK